jgi:hypothetical protein
VINYTRQQSAEVASMGNDCRRKNATRIFTGWLMIFFSAGLLVSFVWDADGNPNTDNLPQMVLRVKAGTEADAEARVENIDDDSPRVRDKRFRWLRWQVVVAREWRWRPLAVPPRGP